MARSGWKLERDNARLDFYYNGTRIGGIDAGGIDLASGKTYDVDGTPVTGSTLDSAYNGGSTITVDAAAVKFDGSHGSNDTFQVVGAGTGALIDLDQNSSGLDVEGSDATWTVTKLGVAKFDSIDTIGQIKFVSDTLGADILKLGYDGTDFIWNVVTGKSLDLRVANTNVVTITGSAVTLAQATTISTGGLIVSDTGLTVTTGGASITGNTTVTGDLTVTGNHTWDSALTVDELLLDTDGDASTHAAVSYVLSDNSGDTTINSKTGKEVHLSINNNDEFSVSGTEVDIHGNVLVLDADGNTKLDCATGDTIKIYVAGSQDFTITANLFSVLSGSVLNINDGVLFQVGTTGDGVLYHSATGPGANATIAGVLIGTSVTKATANNSTFFSNITTDADIMICVNDNGASKGLIFLDGDAGDLYLGSTTTGHLTVGDVDEYTWDASDFIIASGNDIKFAGNDGINDSAGNELIRFVATGSATNYLGITNSNGGNILFENEGSTADQGFTFLNDQAEEILVLNSAVDSVEEIIITSAAAGAGVKIASSTSATDAHLRIDTEGAGNIFLMLGGVDVLGIHDSAITLAAAGNTAGHALFMQTEDAGTATSQAGDAGAAWEMRTGDGAAGNAGANAGGAGGALTLVTGIGNTGIGAGAGGDGGAIALTAGAGGTAGTGAAGAGGDITLTAGAGGSVGSGTTGIPGAVVIGAGVLKQKVQTIAMSGATVTLTLDPTDPVLGTLLTGNILYVDAEGGTPALKLPDEDDCTGIMLVIENTGGETILVQDDGAGAVVTLETANTAVCICNGTTWNGFVGLP